MELSLDWNGFKSRCIENKQCDIQYIEYTNSYFIFAIDSTIIYICVVSKTIPLNVNQIDFEDNHKVHANKKITPSITEDKKLKVETYQASGTANEIKIKDGEGNIRFAKVDSLGRLLVSQEPPTPPPASIAVKITQYGFIVGTIDDIYIIPNGQTLMIQRFSASAELDSTGGSVVELYYDPLGTGSGMSIIEAMFLNGSSSQKDLNESYVGDGIRTIRLRRRRLSGGSKEIFARWKGYY